MEKSLKPGLSSEGDTDADWADWNAEQNAEVRHALGLLIDRNYLVDVVMQSGETPASGFVATNMDDGTGTDFRSKAGDWWSNDPADKQANIDQALEILKKYYDYDEASGQFTNFPAFEFSMNPSTRNVMIVSAVQDMWGDYGIAPTIDQRDWAVITTALTEGDFTASRLGWIADYTDPSTFLEVYESASGNNHPRLGKDGPIGSGAYYGPNKDQTWKELYDGLLAGIKTESDLAARAELMYEAEEVLRDTYVLLPLFYYVNPYLVSEDLKEYIYSPLGWVNFKYAYMA
ncbi:MAG: ABC transporter substrate-binding protein [Oscillospiraceae bacterium]